MVIQRSGLLEVSTHWSSTEVRVEWEFSWWQQWTDFPEKNNYSSLSSFPKPLWDRVIGGLPSNIWPVWEVLRKPLGESLKWVYRVWRFTSESMQEACGHWVWLLLRYQRRLDTASSLLWWKRQQTAEMLTDGLREAGKYSLWTRSELHRRASITSWVPSKCAPWQSREPSTERGWECLLYGQGLS